MTWHGKPNEIGCRGQSGELAAVLVSRLAGVAMLVGVNPSTSFQWLPPLLLHLVLFIDAASKKLTLVSHSKCQQHF